MRDSMAEAKKLIDNLQPFIWLAKLNANLPTGEVHLLGGQLFLDVLEFLDGIKKQSFWPRLVSARKLVPEEMWASYNLLQITGLREQKILDSALDEFRRYWRQNVPGGFFGKDMKYEDYEDTIEEDTT